MYGLVLMAALSTAPETPSFGWGRGCTGCSGFVSTSCYGSSCFGSSCYGSSCYGSCHGGGLFSRLRGMFAGRCHGCYSTCHGCYSSCMGSSCFGSSCFGSSCFGNSCVGSMNPPGVTGPFGPQSGWAAHGVYYAEPGAIPHGHPVTITPGAGSGSFGDSYLNYSGYGSPIFNNRTGTLTRSTHYGDPIYTYTSFGYGVGFGSGPVYYGPDFHPAYGPCCVDGLPTTVTPPQVRIDNSGTGTEVTRARPQAAPARLTVELPADATLYVDGALVKGEGASRNFHTPDLPAGQTFYYELKAEVTVGGKTITEAKTVLVKAGEASAQSFGKLLAAAGKTGDALAKK